jgi:hypothetical protein
MRSQAKLQCSSRISSVHCSSSALLWYLMLTGQTHLSSTINKVFQFEQSSATRTHMTTAKVIPRYVKGTFKGGLSFEKASSTLLSAFSDGD